MYFAVSIMTTVGYGDMDMTLTKGDKWCVAYAASLSFAFSNNRTPISVAFSKYQPSKF